MEIKIGIQHVNREVVIDSDATSDAVEKAVTAALTDGTVLTLTDERGRKVLVPSSSIGYVDIGEESARRVGFGAV